jgi:AhpD family alkylhydroperoxidase
LNRAVRAFYRDCPRAADGEEDRGDCPLDQEGVTMARIQPVEIAGVERSSLDQPDRVQLGVGAIAMHRPEISAAFASVREALLTKGTLSPRLVELVRIRIAFHNQCRSCMAIRYDDAVQDGVTEDLVCSLDRPEEAEDLTDAERAALRFADLFATNHLAIDEAVYDDLRRHFTEGELVELGMNCAIDVGFGRLTATWDVTDDLPAAYQRPYDEAVTPWNTAEPLIVR